ncbi:MAG TPA: hypothetical protein PL029_06295 [Bacteroidia bacterium]|nr:hypothetical protein [Bacteroidia bacterium]
MKRNALLTLFVCCCTFSFSQDLIFSRKFETLKKNVPLAIINSQPGYFCVLRYNKLVHDLVIERRAKPTAEMIGFTPLKLDSVNATWFDYEKLDYLFFEQNKTLYFLFEKDLNFKKTIYLKIIDSLNRSSGFIEIAKLEKEKTMFDFGFEFKTTNNNNILIVTSQSYLNSVKKTVSLFNIQRRKIDWVKKLPLENDHTGYSFAFESNQANDLFYAVTKARVVGTQRRYMNHQQAEVPVLFYDTLTLVSYLNTDPVTIHKKPILANISNLNSVKILPFDGQVLVQAHYALEATEGGDKSIFFLNQRLSTDLSENLYTVTSPLNEDLKQTLTFYDGSDSKQAADKEYRLVKQYAGRDHIYTVCERRDENYTKELLVFNSDPFTGQTKQQYLVPRKVLIFKGRTRLKSIGEVMLVTQAESLNLVVLEAPSNYKKAPAEFNFHKFKRENNLWGSNIVMYTINRQGGISKKLLYANATFDLVPLHYQGDAMEDVIFYLNNNRYETFAFLNRQ